jgi:glycosyltransferase involved in cell wall biosynthesis
MGSGSKPRVAHVIPRLQLRGAEITAQHLAAALDDRFESRVYLLHGGEGPQPDGIPPVEVRAGVGTSGPWGQLRAARNLGRRIRGWSADVVIAHGGDPLRAAILGGAHRAAPVLFRRISSVPPKLRTPLRARSLRFAHGRVSAFVAVSESLKRELVEDFGVPEGRIRVIPPGRPRPAPLEAGDRTELRRQLGASEDDVLVLWVGHLVAEKDPLAAIDLVERLADASPRIVLAMLGDGPLGSEVEARAAGVANVVLAGARPDAVRLMQAADLLVSTSVTEGAPSTFVEALLAGLPVVTPNVGGVRDLIQHAQNGLVVPAGDRDALAVAVRSVASQERERRRLASDAPSSAAAFEIGAIAERYAVVLDSLVADPTGGGALDDWS